MVYTQATQDRTKAAQYNKVLQFNFSCAAVPESSHQKNHELQDCKIDSSPHTRHRIKGQIIKVSIAGTSSKKRLPEWCATGVSASQPAIARARALRDQGSLHAVLALPLGPPTDPDRQLFGQSRSSTQRVIMQPKPSLSLRSI